jgi:hypothetical protein
MHICEIVYKFQFGVGYNHIMLCTTDALNWYLHKIVYTNCIWFCRQKCFNENSIEYARINGDAWRGVIWLKIQFGTAVRSNWWWGKLMQMSEFVKLHQKLLKQHILYISSLQCHIVIIDDKQDKSMLSMKTFGPVILVYHHGCFEWESVKIGSFFIICFTAI